MGPFRVHPVSDNINQYQKHMRQNISLKDLLIGTRKLTTEEKVQELRATPNKRTLLKTPANMSSRSLKTNNQLYNNLSKDESPINPNLISPNHHFVSPNHNFISPKQNFTSPKQNFTSPKQHEEDSDQCHTHSHPRTENMVLREKNFNHVEISQFEPLKNHLKTYIQEPRRPKILNKPKPVLGFWEEFKVGKMLGKGRFGNVFRVQHIPTGAIFAVKQICLEKTNHKLIERMTYQVKIQSYIQHINCLELYKVSRQGKNVMLLLELGEQSLFDLLRQKRYFLESEACHYIVQVIEALKHLHSHGVIHRDIKPENIVLVSNVVKLADFGWSIYVGENGKRTTFCGTLDYVCPQIVLGTDYDAMVDVWSVGVLCYQLCTGHAPFESHKSRQETYQKILNVELKFPKYLSSQVKDFISRLLAKNPIHRMSLEEALAHRWIRKHAK